MEKSEINIGDIFLYAVKRIGNGKVKLQSLFFNVEVTGIEKHFGREMYRIKPVSGDGEMLVQNLLKKAK